MVMSEAQKEAQRRYYEKNRERLLRQMRERARDKADTDAIERADNPVLQNEYRVKLMEKYYKGQNNKKLRQIEGWLKDEGLSDTFKAFLRTCVVPVIEEVKPHILREIFMNFAIAKNPLRVDGGERVKD
jgi:hypothetical protein